MPPPLHGAWGVVYCVWAALVCARRHLMGMCVPFCPPAPVIDSSLGAQAGKLSQQRRMSEGTLA